LKVLLTGSQGQLGYELERTVPQDVELTAVDIGELDITRPAAVSDFCRRLAPDLVINAAAYTAVDRAESEAAAAFAVNALGPGHLAAALPEGSRMIQVSTDFVFDGAAGSPYQPDSLPAPLGVYGASKLEGERQVAGKLGSRALILRTAWLYSSHGANFVKTMLKLLRERESVGVVSDQTGTPTWAGNLARTIWDLAQRSEGFGRILHCTDAGVATWYDFAVAIAEEAQGLGLLDRPAAVLPIPSSRYPTPARRPAFSVLDKTETWTLLGEAAPHWRASLRQMLGELGIG
jgi:dTDP-4-dehydrorhamnose reductase